MVCAVITSVFGALYSVIDGIFVGRFLGEDALAAINLVMPIIMIVEAISNMIATGASVNVSILLGKKKREEASRIYSIGFGYNLSLILRKQYGAGHIKRMKEIFKMVLIASATISILAFLFMYLAGPYVATIFIKPGDKALLNVSITAIHIFSFSYFVGWIDMSFSSFFTAIDKPVRSLFLSIFGTLVFPIVFLFILTSVFGLIGVWLMASIAALASSVLAIILFSKDKV